MMKNLLLPRLHEMGVTTVLGETDFLGGPLAPSIAGAVINTGKTLVFLSADIFQVNNQPRKHKWTLEYMGCRKNRQTLIKVINSRKSTI